MAQTQTLLQLLRSKSRVDCDTMDATVASSLGPFVDCTSNQAIALFELQKPKHQALVAEAIALAKSWAPDFPEVTRAELAVEIAMVKLQLLIVPFVTGFVHVQTNTYYSYDTAKTVKNAQMIVQLAIRLDPSFDVKRICIKIPSTWEGLLAIRTLEASGIATLATTLFTLEQAALAGEVGATYIAPYVNELKVHFEPGFIDNNKAQAICLETQRYYEKHNLKTQVLPASLTSTDEIVSLAGVHHITIAPGLLDQLSHTPVSSSVVTSLFETQMTLETTTPLLLYGDKEAEYRIAFTRSGRGEGERKLSQAINIFCDMQTKLEAMMTEDQGASE